MKSDGKNSQNHQISRFGFGCVVKYIEGQLKFRTSNLVYNHIWLNPHEDDHHFFYNLWMITILVINNFF